MKARILLILLANVTQAGNASETFPPLGADSGSIAHVHKQLTGKKADAEKKYGSDIYSNIKSFPANLWNPKTVIPGIYYRGGSTYGDSKKTYKNHHALDLKELKKLCTAGFSYAFFLYGNPSINKDVECTYRGKTHSLKYRQSSWKASRASKVLQAVDEVIRDSELGPVYVHCNFGNHASGAVAAYALKQFCGVTSKDAWAYWKKATRANSGYNHIAKEIGRLQINQSYVKAPGCPNP